MSPRHYTRLAVHCPDNPPPPRGSGRTDLLTPLCLRAEDWGTRPAAVVSEAIDARGMGGWGDAVLVRIPGPRDAGEGGGGGKRVSGVGGCSELPPFFGAFGTHSRRVQRHGPVTGSGSQNAPNGPPDGPLRPKPAMSHLLFNPPPVGVDRGGGLGSGTRSTPPPLRPPQLVAGGPPWGGGGGCWFWFWFWQAPSSWPHRLKGVQGPRHGALRKPRGYLTPGDCTWGPPMWWFAPGFGMPRESIQ